MAHIKPPMPAPMTVTLRGRGLVLALIGDPVSLSCVPELAPGRILLDAGAQEPGCFKGCGQELLRIYNICLRLL